MNGHMLRTSAMGQPPAMLGMGNASFMQNPGQMNPQSMVMPPNMSSNPPMNMLGPVNGSIPNNPQNQQHQQQRMLMQHQQAQLANQQQQQRLMRPGQGPQGLMAPGNGQVPAPHMAGLNPQMGHPFAPGMPQAQGQNPALRRVPSQTQMGMNNGVVSGGMSLPQSQPQSAHMRQLTQMRAAQHQQQQQQLMVQQQAHMLRQAGGSAMPPSMSGVGPSQNPVMSSLSQPSIGQQHNAMGLGQNQMQHPFANGVGMSNSQVPHGLSSSSPRPPNGMGMASGPSQAGPRASMTPDNANAMSFINYPGTQFSPGGQRMSGATQQYPFAPASTPPVSDMSDQSRGAFPTPAQQLQMNSSAGSMNSATDPFAGPSFAQPMAPRASQHHNNMQPHPIHTPQLSQRQTPQPTSQSHNTPQPGPSAVLHHSPIHTSNPSDHLPMQPSRPQSRPQSQPQISHNQAASPHGQTPRSGQVPLPPGATIAVPGRGGQQPPPPPTNIPPPPQSQQRPPLQQQHTGGQPPTPGGSQPEQFIGNRPPTMGAPAPPPPTTGPTTLPSGRPAPITSPMLGNGQGLLRMLQFSGILSSENKSKLQLAWWNELVKEYFTPKAVTKITLWKDNAQVEAKPFEIGIPVLLVSSQDIPPLWGGSCPKLVD
ncbi:hypothetical protein D9611_007589 [Ephemerocybe angulata]|uniref:Uncharacterized protein n=1 Tax=Ephemerocybe angulata TaxID=980116 RepID=A0A8H5FCG0_9AGAR|nr:hypothetical protein D9611_007589 [Tulosesus angulatus]